MKNTSRTLLAIQGLVAAATCGAPATAQTVPSDPSSMAKGGLRLMRTPVEFMDGPVILKGTAFIPDGESAVPGVVILGGSERGPRTRLKERLAEHFASEGVAVLIYDSAGTGQSTGNALIQTRAARAEEVSLPKTLSGVFRARRKGVWQHHIVDEADASDGFQVDSALNSGRRGPAALNSCAK